MSNAPTNPFAESFAELQDRIAAVEAWMKSVENLALANL